MPKKQQLEDLLADDSFIKWIKGHASRKQQEYWVSWMHKNPEHSHLVEQARELVELIDTDSTVIPNPHKELKKFEDSFDRLNPLQDFVSIKRTNKSGLWSKNLLGAIAAGLLILIVSVGFFLTYEQEETTSDAARSVSSQHREFRTDYGEKISLTLSDGSLIILNSNSYLKYTSTTQAGQNIEVWLEGEAYFDITHLKGENQRLFTVHTKDGSVKVLGTTFVVNTSADATRAVLKEGEIKIKVKTEDGPHLPEATLVMKPGDLAQFRSGSEDVILRKVNPRVYTSWIQNKWVFEGTPLSQVIKRIENNFGVKVEIRGKELREKRLWGAIKSTNLKILKKALSKVLQVPVTREDRTIIIGKGNSTAI